MISEPLPDQGWSRQIRQLQDAVIVPAEAHDQTPGVWKDGDIAEAVTWREGIRQTGALEQAPSPTRRLEGSYVWGGIFYGHFGHFIVETISRLWAARQLGINRVLFTPRHAKLRDFVGYQDDLVKLILPDAQIDIIREPTAVEQLFVPGQGFGLGKISRGTEEFRAMIRDTMARIEPETVDKIYISRTKFGGKGGIIGEHCLEESFVAEGYTLVHPEKMPLKDQLAIFKGARKIVGLDSSAFHTLGYVANPSQDICIILRRNHPAYEHITHHIEAFCGRAPHVISAVTADWMPERQRLPNHVSWGELDHVQVRDALVAHGFLQSAESWVHLNEARLAEAVEWAETRSKEPLVRRIPQPDRVQKQPAIPTAPARQVAQ